MLEGEVKLVHEGFEVHIIDIEHIDAELRSYIDEMFVSICEGGSDTALDEAKRYFLKFLSTKDDKKKIGAVSEFFVHLYLVGKSFKQEFLFFNLEEGSVKKGFDGYFSKLDEEYIVESKSGRSTSVGISHKSKVDTAYRDICDALVGGKAGGANNPWRNAFNHASHADVGTNSTIRKNIKSLSKMYEKGEYASVEDLNLIPCSTIFIDQSSSIRFSDSAKDAFNDSDYVAKSTLALCITKATFDEFMLYLGAS